MHTGQTFMHSITGYKCERKREYHSSMKELQKNSRPKVEFHRCYRAF